ncbi:hypothetical protein ABZ635_03125 [Nocardiopsis sp. NPDC007018]|uniref:hypothetical protein n=1 Tax=Nocardiopsis sp. NPDC007018 TaxID=3155721 RepID=UPI0033CB5D3F
MKRIIAALIALPLAFSLVSASPSSVSAKPLTKAEMECREYLSQKGYVVGEKSRTACSFAKTNVGLCRYQLEVLGVSEAHYKGACGARDASGPKPDPWAG